MIRRFPKFINIPRFIPISLLSFILMILSTYFLLLFWLSHRIWIGVSSHKKIIETFTVKCFALERFHQFLHRHQFLCLPYCIYINCKTQLAMSNILVKKQKFQFYNSFFFLIMLLELKLELVLFTENWKYSAYVSLFFVLPLMAEGSQQHQKMIWIVKIIKL